MWSRTLAMTQALGFDVYLSYSRADRELVTELERLLVDAGLRVWRDETGIEVGEQWQMGLASALARARLVAVCVGPTGLGPGQLREVQAGTATTVAKAADG